MHTEATATVELGGEERDVLVRAYVERTRLYGGNTLAFAIDGEIEAFVGGRWVDAATLDATPVDLRIMREAICDVAEFDAYGRNCA